MQFEYLFGNLYLKIEAECLPETEDFKTELNTATTWIAMMPTIWKNMKQESKFWCTRMQYFHKHRRPSPKFI
jgi:hypothetical protein